MKDKPETDWKNLSEVIMSGGRQENAGYLQAAALCSIADSLEHIVTKLYSYDEAGLNVNTNDVT